VVNHINNFRTSGHPFSERENLQRFRFSMLNSLMLIAAFFTLLNFFASKLKLIEFAPIYDYTLLFYASACIFSIFLLRLQKSYYFISLNIVLLSSLILFYMALFVVRHDEFRLIWFFIVVLASFILMSKRYGMVLMFIVLTSIVIINRYYDMGFSKLAQFTFINSFLIFTAFFYFFIEKIEKDAYEFEQLNLKLKNNVIQEREQREKQEQMLLRQCRMANMGEMLDSIAHQWRQPLMHINSILMNIDVALEVKHKDEQYLRKKTEEVSSLTSHMSQTIEDFRDLFKLEVEQKYFVLETAVNDVLFLMKNVFNNIEVVYKSRGNTNIVMHRSELIQVLIIIMSNAVEVLSLREIENMKIIIENKAIENNVTITIEDNAGGIIPENLSTIFDPYFTTKEQSGGTGLGLYISKIIVEHKMGGELSVTNTTDGAKFTIVLNQVIKRGNNALYS